MTLFYWHYPITGAKSKGKIKWFLIQELVAAMVHICSKKKATVS
jgi:hypothetical protein